MLILPEEWVNSLLDARHGGDLLSATARFGKPALDWLDLSTGISPWSWPVPTIPSSIWQQLPDDHRGDNRLTQVGSIDSSLVNAAAAYYGCEQSKLIPIAGSQAAISLLPRLLTNPQHQPATVAVPLWGYREHARAWHQAGHRLWVYQTQQDIEQGLLNQVFDHLVVINPNNPTGEHYAAQTLLDWHHQVSQRQGYLILDEAFVDSQPEYSLSTHAGLAGLVILRSIGKFFGLAGIRLGFLLGDDKTVVKLSDELPPWSVSHPAQWIGTKALADFPWHREQRARLKTHSLWLENQISQLYSVDRITRNDLFVTLSGGHEQLVELYKALAKQGILTRLFEPLNQTTLLRVGLMEDNQRERFLAGLVCDSVKG